jgi:enediyne biosynthesis protein E4
MTQKALNSTSYSEPSAAPDGVRLRLPYTLATGMILTFLIAAFRPAPGAGSLPQGVGEQIFTEMAAESGLRFHHFTGATGRLYLPEIMGSGVALLDYDGDGDLDVFFLQGLILEPGKQMSDAMFPPPAGYRPGNHLFRNELVESGKLRFTDVTEKAGLQKEMYGMGAAVGDYDNDGRVDLYATGFGSNVLYHNNGDGTFTDVTAEAGAEDSRWSASAAFLDYDRDGRLDLFVAHYVDFTVAGNKACFSPTREPDYCNPAVYRGMPARLFHNEGNGKFKDVTRESGIQGSPGPGLGVVCTDLNGDGWVDIYVANDGKANHLWFNKRNGTFEEEGLMSGAAYSMEGMPRAGMGVAAADIDGDGDDDLLVTNLGKEGATLFLNDGRGVFTDAGAQFGLSHLTFPFTGFGVDWFDYDNDGTLDLFIADGAVYIIPTLRGSPYPFHQPNQLYHNEGTGRPFKDVASQGGPGVTLSEVSRGAAFGDIDNDGDVDIVVSNNNGPARLLLNQVGSRKHRLQVRLEGDRDNRSAIGARVAVIRKGHEPLWRRVHSDGSYCSASDLRVHFGLGDTADLDGILVQWPSGAKERWTGIKANRLVALRQGSGEVIP